jgi:NAD(P)-dependent dehydrogenase (short-subunit alcohol dehydrogenase family)
MFTLHDRVAVVTGAALGIGARIVAVLAEAGAAVVIADLNYAAAEWRCSFSRYRPRAITNQVLALDAGFSIT